MSAKNMIMTSFKKQGQIELWSDKKCMDSTCSYIKTIRKVDIFLLGWDIMVQKLLSNSRPYKNHKTPYLQVRQPFFFVYDVILGKAH